MVAILSPVRLPLFLSTMEQMLKQYQEMKKKHPDAILLFRVGDFYETYNEDAVVASETLGIVLTNRPVSPKRSIQLAEVYSARRLPSSRPRHIPPSTRSSRQACRYLRTTRRPEVIKETR